MNLPMLCLQMSMDFVTPPFLGTMHRLLTRSLALYVPVVSVLGPRSSGVVLKDLPLPFSSVGVLLGSSM